MTNEEKNMPSYFSILTADVRYDKDLSASEKIFYSEITCLCQKDGYCYANNSYFANLYGCGTRTISSWISKLANKNYINVKYKTSSLLIKKRCDVSHRTSQSYISILLITSSTDQHICKQTFFVLHLFQLEHKDLLQLLGLF